MKQSKTEKSYNVTVKKKKFESEAKGNGPINALDAALRKVLISAFPVLKDVKLVDYKVRILTPNRGTEAVIRVMIESIDKNRNRWSTVGVSANVIDGRAIAQEIQGQIRSKKIQRRNFFRFT